QLEEVCGARLCNQAVPVTAAHIQLRLVRQLQPQCAGLRSRFSTYHDTGRSLHHGQQLLQIVDAVPGGLRQGVTLEQVDVQRLGHEERLRQLGDEVVAQVDHIQKRTFEQPGREQLQARAAQPHVAQV